MGSVTRPLVPLQCQGLHSSEINEQQNAPEEMRPLNFIVVLSFSGYWLILFTNWTTDPENDYLHLDHHVTYADVIIVCFHDILDNTFVGNEG